MTFLITPGLLYRIGTFYVKTPEPSPCLFAETKYIKSGETLVLLMDELPPSNYEAIGKIRFGCFNSSDIYLKIIYANTSIDNSDLNSIETLTDEETTTEKVNSNSYRTVVGSTTNVLEHANRTAEYTYDSHSSNSFIMWGFNYNYEKNYKESLNQNEYEDLTNTSFYRKNLSENILSGNYGIEYKLIIDGKLKDKAFYMKPVDAVTCFQAYVVCINGNWTLEKYDPSVSKRAICIPIPNSSRRNNIIRLILPANMSGNVSCSIGNY